MSDEFKAWLREICERHRDALEEIGWVEVVRCKDCTCDDSNPQHLPCTGWCPPDDFFCAYGERRE